MEMEEGKGREVRGRRENDGEGGGMCLIAKGTGVAVINTEFMHVL